MNYANSRLQQIAQDYAAQLAQAKTRNDLEKIRVAFLGRQGTVSALMAELKSCSPEEKRVLGPELNDFKSHALAALEEKIAALAETERKQREERSALFDVTAYRPGKLHGSLHPNTRIREKLEDIMTSMGFMCIEGPEVELEEINFDALNMPKDHPSRDMQDTFWLTLPAHVLRTQTSAMQVRGMRAHKPPVALASIGRCYRSEATDAGHDYVFYQFEGLLIDKKVSMAHLFATIKTVLQALFDKDELAIRVRPSYFPFVEPAVEVDMQCPFCTAGCSTCKRSRWIEMGGAGLVHPNVLRACHIDPEEFNGFAFGFGLSRAVMLASGIADVRLLHSSKIEFLKQF